MKPGGGCRGRCNPVAMAGTTKPGSDGHVFDDNDNYDDDD